MISLGMVFAFVLEVALYVLVCLWAWGLTIASFPIGMIAVIGVSLIIVARVMGVLLEFVLSYVWRSPRGPEARVGFIGALRIVGAECLAYLVVFCLLLPFARRLVARRTGYVSMGGQLPLLLIHGYAANAGIWAPMINYLWRRGLTNVYTMNLEPTFGNIDSYAQQVAARVNRICNTTRAEKVILVGHSMGGLVARAYVERGDGAARVAKIISIAAPHHGTVLARLAMGRNAVQMRVGSQWLRDLNRDENVPGDIQHVSIYSTHDNITFPQSTAELGKAKNIRVVGKGHFALILSRETGRLVYREATAV